MQARAGAIDELIASGALEDSSGQPNDDITRELEQLSAGQNVDAEIAAMKAQLGSGEKPKAIEGESGDAASGQTQPKAQQEGQS